MGPRARSGRSAGHRRKSDTVNLFTFRRLWVRNRKRLDRLLGRGRKTYFRDRVRQYEEIWSRAAEACGATIESVADDLWTVSKDGVSVRIRNHQIQLDDPVTLIMAGRKPLMHRLLAETGLEVPEHAVFRLDELQVAYDFLKLYPRGCVVKPANGSAAGDGVSTHLRTRREVRDAAVLASLYDNEILIEAQIPGESYRILVVGGKAVNAVCRKGPRVVGDGAATARERIETLNRERKERGEPAIVIDRDCDFTLRWQGWELDGVIPSGTDVLVKAVENPEGGVHEIRTVYNTDVTDRMASSIVADAEAAAAVLGSDFVGVDLLLTDPTRPLAETGGCINEVNTTPALHHHYDSETEPFPAAAVPVLELALRRSASRTPAE